MYTFLNIVYYRRDVNLEYNRNINLKFSFYVV